MPDKLSIQTRIAERLDDFVKEFSPRVAEINRPVLGNVPVNKDERQRRWWQEAKDWKPEQEMLLLQQGMSREDVGLLKYGNREIDARAAGAGDPRKEALYARDMTALGPPPPEPLEAAALATQEGRQLNEAGVSPPPEGPLPPAPLMDGSGAMASAPSTGTEEQHDYSSTQLDLPEPFAAQVRALSQSIPDADLAENGREQSPHVTVKYGLETADPEAIRSIVEAHGPITVTLGQTSIFAANQQEGGAPGNFDVVKVDVDSPELRSLNAELARLPNGDTHPTYNPHATVAYVKPGLGQKYAGDTSLEGQQVTIESLTFSGKDGQIVTLPLVGAPESTTSLQQPTLPGAPETGGSY